jgi:Flp pilus assembly pilin Flp
MSDISSVEKAFARLWTDARGISSVEYAILLSMIAAGLITAAEVLSGAVSGEMTEAASWFGNGECGNDGGGDGTGGAGGSGQGGSNTC